MGVKGTRNKKSKPILSHWDACFDLAMAKGTTYVEVPLGRVWFRKTGNNAGNADVITIKHSYNHFSVDIYEVKVQRSDFLQDVKKGKYKKYLPHCNRLYFAILEGVAKKEEIPEGVGLIVRGENGWHTIKAAENRKIEHSKNMLLALAFSNGRVYQKRRVEMAKNYYNTMSTTDRSRLKGFGKEIKEKILKYNDLELKYNNLLYYASKKIPFASEKEREEFEKEWEDKTYIRKGWY